jgi:hypothetical protein
VSRAEARTEAKRLAPRPRVVKLRGRWSLYFLPGAYKLKAVR